MTDTTRIVLDLQRQVSPPRLVLPVTGRDLAGLTWLERRVGEWIVYVRRRRKRLPRGPLSAVEVEVLSALVSAEASTRRLRQVLAA